MMLEVLSLIKDVPDFKIKPISKYNIPQQKQYQYFPSFKQLLIHLFKKGNNETDCNHPILVILKPDEHQKQQNIHQTGFRSQQQKKTLESLRFRDKKILLNYFFSHHNLLITDHVEKVSHIEKKINTILHTVHHRISRIGTWTGTITRLVRRSQRKEEEEEEEEEGEDYYYYYYDDDNSDELDDYNKEQYNTRVPTMITILNKTVSRPSGSVQKLIGLKNLLISEIDFIDLLSNTCQKRIPYLTSIVKDWSFPAHELSNDELIYCVYIMFTTALKEIQQPHWGTKKKKRKTDLKFHIPTKNELLALIFHVRDSYHSDNPFHNFRHAVDVLQACFYFCIKLGHFKEKQEEQQEQEAQQEQEEQQENKEENSSLMENPPLLNPIQCFALLVAALGHDVSHPGTTNAFLIDNKAPISLIYNERSVLESYHASIFINKILVIFWPSLLETKISGDSKLSIRDIITVSIIATDMSNHFEYLEDLKQLTEECNNNGFNKNGFNQEFSQYQDSKIKLICASLIKSADISNVTRPLEISSQWAVVLQREFDEIKKLEKMLEKREKRECHFQNEIGDDDEDDSDDEASALDFFKQKEIIYEAVPRELDKILLNNPMIPQGQLFFIGTFAENLFNSISQLYPNLSFACEIMNENKKYWEQNK
ncbi:PDE2 [Candida oxycetoniae]|uniref:Phosphodiesterase n=1 Tax=Candida oxycetoniae TaxID=497107 RepID=A0AAI9SWA6_9ASCO|nr:PDE2 [Candida oxycetoniae]KAI3403929.2 PDE2 [Candida oxycetoniae]